MNNQKQKIRTINAKALFKYFPKEKDDKVYAIYLINKALCRHVIKQEEDMEPCPIFDQFYKEIEKRIYKDETFLITNTTLLDKMIVMDFDNIFMSFDKSASDSIKGYRESLQESAKDIIENGFDIFAEEADTPVHMVAFDKSGNMSRKSRISFIDENYYDALNERLNLGMDFSGIEIQESKYYAYRGLYLSSSKRIEHEDFDITPETLVIIQDERKTPNIPDNFEKIFSISAKENLNNVGNNGKVWDIDDQGEKKVLYVDTPFDGVGFIAPSYGKLVNAALGTDGATSFQIRLPFVKGMLHQVDVHGFLDEYNKERSENAHIYIDAFGIKRDLGKARIFITESMFKAKKWILENLKNTDKEDMDPMAFYCDMLKKYDHALYVSGTNLPYGHSKYVHLSYQTINTLDFTKEQFDRILDRHKSFIKNPIEYLNSFDLEAGDDGDSVDSEEGRIDYRIPNWRRALIANEQLSDDIYIKHELKNTQKGLLTKLATGKILVEGQTRYLCRDLLPLLVSLIENPPNFYPKYLYFRFYLPTDGNDANADELGLGFNSYYAFFRNPHLSRNEQYIMRRFCDTDEATYKGRYAYKYYMYSRAIYDKYFGSLTGIVMVPRHSVLPLCLGGADFDGDLVSVVYNQDVADAVASGVFVKADTPRYGEVMMRNLPVIEIPTTQSEVTTIKDHVPYEHIKNTFSNRIGQISDAAISIGQMEYGHVLIEDSQSKTEAREQSVENESKEEKYSKPSCTMCTILTGLEIDAAKNGEHPNLDSILSNDIEKCSYISFLHKFKKLRSEEKYSFDKLKIETKESKGNSCIEVTAKDCSTVAKFYPLAFGTFINELPLAFYDAFSFYAKDGKEKEKKESSKGKKTEKKQSEIVFAYADNKKDEEIKIEEFKLKCQNIFDYHFFYSKNLMYILSSEKNKGFYAIENLERKLYQAYDEEEAVRIQRTAVPRLITHMKSYINDDNPVKDIKDRINEKKWLFVPMEKRAVVLEKIIAGGFSSDILDDDEKGILFNFRNRGYINLWLILSIIEGPKTYTFDEVLSRNIKCNIMVRDKKLEEKLTEYLRAYYNHNASDALGKIYATCLKALAGIMNKSGLSEQNIIAALYEISATSLDNRKFFWDLISWERLEKGLMENIKSYAYDNGKIENGWEGWKKEYTKSLKDEVFGENKKRYSCGSVYCDPDGGNMDYYTRICQFLNAQENKENIISEDKRFHYCVGKYNGECRINVCKEGRFIFCLKTDQFGFSAPRAENVSGPQNVVPQPFCKYYEKEENKEKAITNIVNWIYITRSLGGAFIWPEVKGTSYNIYRGGSIPRDNRRYMQDRVDLALLDVLHFLSNNIEQYDVRYGNDILHSQIINENTHMKEWLEHFGSFETFVTYFMFDDFVEKKDGKIDGVKSIIDGEKLNDEGRKNCELPQDSEGLYKVLDRITDMIYKRTNKMEEILKE